MLTKEEFAKAMKDAISKRNDKYDIEIQRVVKMNDTELFGLIFKEEGKEACPTVYIDTAYEEYLDGASIEYVSAMIEDSLAVYTDAAPANGIDMSWDNVKDKIGMRLINTALNREYLSDKVHRDFDNGLSLVFEVDIDDNYSAVITKSLAEDRNYDEAELMTNACSNGKAMLTDMAEALFMNKPENLLERTDTKLNGNMYVLSNRKGTLGASAIYMDGVAEKVAELIGNDYYLLPSSIHEFIIVPNDGSHDAEALKEIVIGANRNVVDRSEWLSDHVYQYRDERIVEVA